MAMNICIHCGSSVTVINSRSTEGFVRRRYRCEQGHRFNTDERVPGDDREAALKRVHDVLDELNKVMKRLTRSTARRKVQRVPEAEAA